MINILLTGGSGFLGQSILNSDLFKNYKIFAPSSKELNLINKNQLENFLNTIKPSWIINCAVKGGRRTKKDTAEDFFNNVKCLDNILSFINQDCKLITFSSGAEIYKSDDFYGFSKKISTSLIKDKLNIKNLRIYNIFGKLGMKDSFVYDTITKSLKNENIEIWENKKFDIYPVENLIKLLGQMIEENSSFYKEIDCVYIEKYTLAEIAQIIIELCTSKSKIIIQKESQDSYIGKGSSYTDNTNLEDLNQALYNLINEIKNEKI